MDVKFRNLIGVLLVLAALIAALVGYYFTINVGAITIGTVGSVANNDALGLSNTMETLINSTETDFSTNVSTANNTVPIVFGLVALVAIIMIFNFNPLSGGKGGAGVQ